jgi:hypothetical protein
MTDKPEIDPERLPRSMEGEGLKILPFYTEAGRFTEANVIKVTYGTRIALYVPYQVCKD